MNKELTRGVVDPIVLQLVSEKAMYGYEIIKIVNQRTSGQFKWNEGSLYPCLHRLEGDGLIESEWQTADSGRKRKYYKISKSGLQTLQSKTEEWGHFTSAVNAVLFPAKA